MKYTYKTYEEYNEAIQALLTRESLFITLCSKPKGIFKIEIFDNKKKFTLAVNRRKNETAKLNPK